MLLTKLPQTNAPLESMVARGIDRGKYDATLRIRRSLQKVVSFVRPFANDAAAAAFEEIPQSISHAILQDLRKLSEIAKEMPIKCQRQTTSLVPPSYNGQEAAIVQIVDQVHSRLYHNLRHFRPLTAKSQQDAEHEARDASSDQLETRRAMTDAELRNNILEWFYEHRGEGNSSVDPSKFPDMPPAEITRICDQLKSQGLIEWKTPGGSIVGIGFGRITANGSDQIEQAAVASQSAVNPIFSNKVFIVHGHDGELKESTARLVTKLGLEPIILHEQANRGRTIIEKFADHAEQAGFAIVLLSTDDEGRSRETPSNPLKLRARQNVVFEMGFFFAKLGRGRVRAVYKPGVEQPSDIHGILYVEHDSAGKWQYDVAKEIKAAGYVVNLERI
jgi:predicted nucleotide-binding protein